MSKPLPHGWVAYGTLAFDGIVHASAVRLGVLTGSLISGVFGYLVMRLARPGETVS